MGRRSVGRLIDDVYERGHSALAAEEIEDYHRRHGVRSLCILTQTDRREAQKTAAALFPVIYRKRVVEIGAGVGLLAVEMARHAASVVAIEADPAWSWVFTEALYREKPPNLTWIFGTAESVAEWLRADVAIICTRSGRDAMRSVAGRMAPRVHFVFGDPRSGGEGGRETCDLDQSEADEYDDESFAADEDGAASTGGEGGEHG